MPVLGERPRLASAGGEGAPLQYLGRWRVLPVLWRGRALPVLEEMARLASTGGNGALCQCWGRGRTLLVLGDWVHLANDGEEDAPC